MARRLLPTLAIALASLMACGPADRASAPAPDDRTGVPEAGAATTETGVVEAITTDYAFTAPPTVPSGWTTWRMTNEGEQPHFLLIWRLPEDKNFGDFASEISQPFNTLYAEYRSGAVSRSAFLEKLGATIPEWFARLERRGGPGYTAPGRTSETTVRLDPGEYVMECYVKAPEPEVRFHNALGMLRPLIVTDELSGVAPPEPDVRMTLSNYEIAIDGELTAGEHTVRVDVTEEPEGGLLGHNVQLVRLDADTSVERVGAWTDWVDELQPPAPAEFLGGAGQLQAGHTSYFTVSLEPGRYAWVSEGFAAQGMAEEFTIE